MAQKILHIEDEMRLQKILAQLLEKEGFKVFGANDGELGLKIAEEEHPDLVLLDLILPKKDGFEVLAAIRAKEATKTMPVLILTNLEEKYDIERALSYGVKAYLVKANYRPEEVVEKVKEILNPPIKENLK